MKNYAKVGGRKGKPGYRTPSKFKIKQCDKIKKLKGKYVDKSKSLFSSRQARNN